MSRFESWWPTVFMSKHVRVPAQVALLVLDVDEDVVAVRVAPPALERPPVVQLLHLDVLGVVDRPAGLPGDHVQVVRVGRTRHRREEVVAEHELVRPLEVVRHVRAVELRVGEVRPVLADREPVHLPVVVHRVPRRRVVGKVARQPLGAAAQPDLLAPSHAGARAVGARVPAEDVVEASVLEHQVHDAIDGPARGELLGRGARERRSGLGARRQPLADARRHEEPGRSRGGSAHELSTGESVWVHGRIEATAGAWFGRSARGSGDR